MEYESDNGNFSFYIGPKVTQNTIAIPIRKYGSTFYIGIAMVVLPYFGPLEN